jgi:membrane fusion protein
MKGALAKREALGLTQAQTELQAPISGYLEAMVARPGDLLQAGQPVAKLIPDASPMVGVAFLEEKDRASVKVGDSTQLELEAYPPSEFGTLRGRILRISSDLASPYEVREALGEEAKLEAPAYRVDIEILPIRPKRLKGLPLHAGALFQARFILRRQRIIALVLEPLRRWLE